MVAILAFLYLTITSGVIVNWHYCMGELASIKMGIPQSSKCDKCGMADKKGCCESEYKFIKVQDEHQWAKTAFDVSQFFAAMPSMTASFHAGSYSSISAVYEPYHAPPDNRENSIYIHTGVFRI